MFARQYSRCLWMLLSGILAAGRVYSGAGTASPVQPAEVEAVVTTEMGQFRLELAPAEAPRHVAQFVKLVQEGYYTGSAFFRVVPNGIIQGGDPLLKATGIPKKLWGTGGLNLLPGEIGSLRHQRGTVSAVRLPDKPDSDGSQFFICVSPQPALDGKYSVFGKVTEGLDVVERISRIPADANGIVDRPVRILKITFEPKKLEPFANATLDQLKRTVTLRTTVGNLKIEMQPEWAPENVRRFLLLASTGWYNGTAFHRLSKGFVVQGGTAETRLAGPYHPADRWIGPIKGEFRSDVKHDRGIVSFAHGENPDSATTSFFLVLGPAPHLDGKFSAFGKIVAGLDTLDAFEKEVTDDEKPKRRLEIIEATVEPEAPESNVPASNGSM